MNSNAKRRLKLNLSIFFLSVWCVGSSNIFAQDTLVKAPKLGYFELIGGADFRTNFLNRSYYSIYNSDQGNRDTIFGFQNETKKSFYEGVFFRIQTSFFAMYFQEKFKKLHFGDLVSVEASLGYSNSSLKALPSGFQTFYNCEFGFFAMYRFSKHTDLWMSIGLYRFNRDYFSDVYSGSDYLVRFRHKSWLGELGIASENKMYFGVFNFISKGENLNRLILGLKYYLNPNRIVGLRLDASPIGTSAEFNEGKQNIGSLKIFYGINF